METLFGPKYPVCFIWAPLAPEGPKLGTLSGFIPCAGITNAVNLSHGKYSYLQTVFPGGKWTEVFLDSRRERHLVCRITRRRDHR